MGNQQAIDPAPRSEREREPAPELPKQTPLPSTPPVSSEGAQNKSTQRVVQARMPLALGMPRTESFLQMIGVEHSAAAVLESDGESEKVVTSAGLHADKMLLGETTITNHDDRIKEEQ